MFTRNLLKYRQLNLRSFQSAQPFGQFAPVNIYIILLVENLCFLILYFKCFQVEHE